MRATPSRSRRSSSQGRARGAWGRLKAFQNGQLRALVSARVLNEGVDVPDASVGIVVGGAHGEREHVQRVGRVLRPAPNKRAVAYHLVTSGTSEVGAARRMAHGLTS